MKMIYSGEMNMSLYEFDYTKMCAADTVAKSRGCIYNRDTSRTTGDFAVIMKEGSYAEWKISSWKSGKFTVTVKYSSDIDGEIIAALGVNAQEEASLKFVSCRYYARTKKEYRTGVIRCTRAVVKLKEGENILFIKLPEYGKYGTVSIDALSVSDGRLCEMRQPVYDISDFTMENDGRADCTDAFQRALDCCKDGGGTLYIHDGEYLISGVALHSDTTVYVDETARIYGSENQNAYPLHNVSHTYIQEYREGFRALFYSEGSENIVITGGGIIGIKDGDSDIFEGHEWQRPTVITFISCSNIVISNVDIKESGSWTIILLECNNAIIDSINLEAANHINRDGIDPVDSEDIFITNSTLQSGDDVICPKSGTYKGVRNLHVRNCALSSCGANGIKFGSSSYQKFVHCTFEDIVMIHINLAGISLGSADGAEVDGIHFYNIKMSSVRVPVSILNGGGVRGRRIDGAPMKRGYMKNITIENLFADKVRNNLGSHIDGRCKDGVSDRVSDILLKNVHIECKGGHCGEVPSQPDEYNGEYPDYYWCDPTMPAYGLYVRHTDNIHLVNCEFTLLSEDSREAVVFNDCTNVVLSGTSHVSGGKPESM